MTRAIWYRHWLEIRFPVTIAGIVVALLCLLAVTVVWLGAAGPPRELDRSPWVAGHIWSSGAVVLFLGLLLWGSGVRTAGHPSLYYTLTLPAARFTLIWTRFAVGAAATAALFAALLAAGAAALLVAGRGAPLGAMATTSVLAGLLAVSLQAVLLLLSLWDTERLGAPTLTSGVVVGSFVGWSLGKVISDNTEPYDLTPAVLSVIASQTAPWNIAGVLVLIVAASLCLAAVTARRRDF